VDTEIKQTRICSCGREVISVAGTCGTCIKEGSEAFWLFCNDQITFAGFMRRLRKRGK
jgi:hypothetical protein